MTTVGSWKWTAQGKHPLAKDFLCLGPNIAAAQAFARWVDAGFSGLAQDKHQDSHCSWRFWADSAKQDELICGLLRASCDGVGRTYPLLFLGTGALPGWERRWELLPAVLDTPWRRLERLACHKFRDLDQFREELGKVGAPVPLQFEMELGGAGGEGQSSEGVSTPQPQDVAKVVAEVSSRGVVFIPLEAANDAALQALLASWLRCLKQADPAKPVAVFIGGLPDRTCLAISRQALGTEHFARLWTAPMADAARHGSG